MAYVVLVVAAVVFDVVAIVVAVAAAAAVVAVVAVVSKLLQARVAVAQDIVIVHSFDAAPFHLLIKYKK